MSLPLGQPITLTFLTYSDAAQTTLAGTTTVSIDVLDPAGVTTTYTLAGGQVVHGSTGTYTLAYTPALAGHYAFHWSSTGTVATALDGSFDVDAEYANVTVTQTDFALYLNNPAAGTDPRARFILDKAQQLCETIVKPLPAGSDIVILDVAERAYANPTNVRGSVALYSEGEGPFADNSGGTVAGGLWLQENNVKTLRRLAGQSGGAFTIDLLPAGYTPPSLPPWDSGQDIQILNLP
jgi:hypothetical protein